ncbi:putative quinol monooxygenase [Undibacterium sp. TJN19]|uniref:putative quinol monooxygenase n=1 Tax=Undibacterium sp. TJN19 TaxID=3413055 RepID=UPI003BF24C50
MLLLLAELHAHAAAQEEVKTMLEKLVASTQQEAGSLFYAVHQQQDQPDHFMVYELYRDKAACDVHLQSLPVKTALQRMETLLRQAPKITFCDTVAHTSLKT